MDTQPVPSDNGGGPPTLAQPGVVRAVCLTCAYTWTGAAAEQPAGCPHDGRELVVTAATGETVEQAIAAAAQAMPERVEPRQQTLPGTRPAFDEHAALQSIYETRSALRSADAQAAQKGAAHKVAQKYADAIRSKLDVMIDSFEQRQAEWYGKDQARDERREPEGTDATGDAPETSPVSAGHDDTDAGEGTRDQCGDAEPDRAGADDGRADADAGAELAPGEGTGVAPTYEELAKDASNAATLALLHRAGADQITLAAVDAWSEAQYTAARAWALEQIEAHANDAPGKQTSVQWPAHVSLAHHGPPMHTPKKRTKQKTSRRRAR
jgi:hypothetical protein